MIHATTRKDLETLISEINQKDKYESIYMRFLEKANSCRQKVEWWLTGLGEEEMREFLFNGSRISLRDDEKLLGIDSGDGYTT